MQQVSVCPIPIVATVGMALGSSDEGSYTCRKGGIANNLSFVFFGRPYDPENLDATRLIDKWLE